MKKILFLLLLAAPLQAATYYVSKTGTNGACTAADVAGNKSTITAGLACLSAGDTLIVHTGTYAESISSITSGTAGNVKTVRAAAGEVVTIAPTAANSFGALLTNKSYIKIKGFIIDGSAVSGTSYDGVKMDSSSGTLGTASHHITLEDLEIKNWDGMGVSIARFVNNILVTAVDGTCKVHDNGDSIPTATQDHGFYIRGTDSIMEKCEIYNHAYGAGIQIYDDISSSIFNITVRQNNFHDNRACVSSHADTNTQIYNNLCYESTNSGGFAAVLGGSNNGKIFNNSFYTASPWVGSANGYAAIYIGAAANNWQVRNNLIYGGSAAEQINNNNATTSFTANACGFAQAPVCDSALVLGASSPFVSAPTNFNLTASNKARGSGVNLYSTFTTDYAGTTRQITGAWDVGAYRASTADSITLHSPIPGESILKNTSYNVTWTTTGTVGVLDIKYGTNGTTYPTTLVAGTANDESQSVTMPNTATTTAYIQICNAGATICDTTGPFTILDSTGGSQTKIISANTSGTYTGTIQGVSDAPIIQGAPTENNGTSGTNVGSLFATKYAANDHAHSLLKFDGISQIPTTATLTSVTLGLYVWQGGGGIYTMDIRRLLRNWVETAATWNKWGSGVSDNWTTGGGLGAATDRTSTAAAQIVNIRYPTSLPACGVDPTCWYSVTQTSGGLFDLVQGWINGTIPNYGVHLERNGTGNDSIYSYFASSNNANTSQRPYLSVTYTTTVSTITLVSPSTGDRMAPGQPVPIRWTSSGVSGTINGYISYNGGTYYQPAPIVSAPYYQSDAVWTVDGPSGNNVRFKVCDSLSTCSESGNTRIAGRYHGD